MSKHTPGPWKVVPVAVDLNIGIVAGDAAWLLNITGKDLLVAEANARLIAAAPEMLELLEEACAESETHLRDRITELLTRINPTT